MTYRTELPRMRLAEFCGQTEYPAVCYLHYKLLLREQIARAAPHRRLDMCSPQSDRRQRERGFSNEFACSSWCDAFFCKAAEGCLRAHQVLAAGAVRAKLTNLWTSVRGFSSPRAYQAPADVGGVAAQSEMPNRTSFSEVPAARVPRFGDSGRTEAAKLVSIKQESRSMSRGP